MIQCVYHFLVQLIIQLLYHRVFLPLHNTLCKTVTTSTFRIAKTSVFAAPGIDFWTSRLPGKSLNHYTTCGGSQILKMCSQLYPCGRERIDRAEQHASQRSVLITIWVGGLGYEEKNINIPVYGCQQMQTPQVQTAVSSDH